MPWAMFTQLTLCKVNNSARKQNVLKIDALYSLRKSLIPLANCYLAFRNAIFNTKFSSFKVVRVISRNKTVSSKVTIIEKVPLMFPVVKARHLNCPKSFIPLNDSSRLVDSLD